VRASEAIWFGELEVTAKDEQHRNSAQHVELKVPGATGLHRAFDPIDLAASRA
jgi:hypothetical protein